MREKQTAFFCVCVPLVVSSLKEEHCTTKHFFLAESNVRQFHIREFTGWWRYDSTHDYLWLFEREPTSESGLSLQIKKKQWGVVLSEARVLVADKLTRCGALRSFLSAASFPYTHTHTNTPTHSMFLLISKEREPPLQPHNRSAFPRSLSPHSHLFGRWNQSISHRWHAVALETYKKRRWEERGEKKNGETGSCRELCGRERRSKLGMAESERWKE